MSESASAEPAWRSQQERLASRATIFCLTVLSYSDERIQYDGEHRRVAGIS